MSGDAEVIGKFKDMAMTERTEMDNKEFVWVPDNNGSSYNGQIVFDLSSLGQTNKWLNYSEAYIMVPYVVSIKATNDISTTFNKDSFVLKDGFHQLIDNISVEINQKTVVQVQNFTNFHSQFKLLTTSSYNDLIKNSTTKGFYKDSVNAIIYKTSASATGKGIINTGVNSQRKDNLNYDVYQRSQDNSAFVNKDDIIKSSGRSYYINDEGVGADRYYHYVYMTTIKLSDISDVFDKIPLCKTSDVRITLNYNSFDTTVRYIAAVVGPTAANASYDIQTYQQISGHSCPVVFTPVVATPLATTDTQIRIRGNVMRSGLTSGGSVPEVGITNCRLYVPIYKVSDRLSLSMLQTYPVTKFEYNDIYTYIIPSVVASSPFVHTITTGIINPKYLVVIPLVKTNTLLAGGAATYQSVFDTCPGTTSGVRLAEFNVQLAGLNVFQQNMRYDFEQYISEVSKINAINGNNTLGITSGLLSMDDWQDGYRMYVADLSRREPSQDNVTKSIVVTGVNTSSAEIELICFVAYSKTLQIKTATGEVLD